MFFVIIEIFLFHLQGVFYYSSYKLDFCYKKKILGTKCYVNSLLYYNKWLSVVSPCWWFSLIRCIPFRPLFQIQTIDSLLRKGGYKVRTLQLFRRDQFVCLRDFFTIFYKELKSHDWGSGMTGLDLCAWPCLNAKARQKKSWLSNQSWYTVFRIRDPVPSWHLDPGWVESQNPVRIRYLELRNHFFWVKILKFFDADPGYGTGWKQFGSGIRDG